MTRTKLLLVALAIVALAAAALVGRSRESRASVPAGGAQASAAEATQAALIRTPQARAYRDRQGFRDDAKRFFRDAAALSAAERTRQAQRVERGIDGYERAGELSAGETMLLRVALIQATVPDQAEQMRQVEALATQYRELAERRNAQYLAQQRNDPRFQSYKQREAAVVAEVMALRQIPGGLTRDEYLRQRLQAERERAYR
ncbi:MULTISPECIES: hypothetical protein [unclassified Lysobacter]|uniref:hypothetical protein n=1 Tax=unclassified Lysobacter TaxID=2635362 RepID=UPI0006FB4108|nr:MULTISPECIES: hypothetical protein [unclassified Lysobacter]KQZ55980.1 hypothetical protein ASD53_14165 [Lysobacter sp. Root559]KRC31951.1 hypothetical protein ASE10_15355 [Lysobacter sp. Root76]KRD67416.1 hypothetical protein ASE45_11530 [Lysobacter sp. Root96]